MKLDAKGFSLLELLVVCSIVAILAGMAVPKVENIMAQAHSARIEADLTTIDAAVVMYENEEGKIPHTMSDLQNYLRNASQLKPPVGHYRLADGSIGEVQEGTLYQLKAQTTDESGQKTASLAGTRATCNYKKAEDFGR